jgi:hypothetical protein
MPSVEEKSLHFNKSIKINFDGGTLSSDSGLLLYKEFDEKLGLSRSIEHHLDIDDMVQHRTHPNHEVVIQKVYQHLAGYHTDDQSDELREEPVFTTILEKERLASQPTMSRLNQKFSQETVQQLQTINQVLLDRVEQVQPRDYLLLDVDSANFTTCGNQEGSTFNAHYQTNGFHPLFLFDGLTGDCIKADLRPGNVYTSRDVAAFSKPIIHAYREKHPWLTIILRGDSGFAVPDLYSLCEEYEIHYAIRLKANNKLNEKAQAIEEQLRKNLNLHTAPAYVFYKEFEYQANSWEVPRRVVVKLEKPEGELFFHYTFIVTSLSYQAKNVVKFYQNRGTMENFIKEGKNGFAFDQLSSPDFDTNATKLQIAVLAYNMHRSFQRLCMPKKKKVHQMETVRTQLVKIAGKIVRSGRYITFKLCSSCLYQKDYWETLKHIQELPSLE